MIAPALLRQIAEAIEGMRFGQVQITIHDARVVQIDKIEKIRLADRTSGSSAPIPPDGVASTHRA
jgi:hypothetical protein